MRTTTLVALAFAIAWVTIFLFRELLGWLGFGRWATSQFGTTIIASLVLTPLILFLLNPLNKKLLARRKTKGRDIPEEERHESDHGMIG